MRKLAFLVLALFVMVLCISQVHVDVIEVSGAINGNVTEIAYGVSFYVFPFNVQWSSDNSTSRNITCAAIATHGPFSSAPAGRGRLIQFHRRVCDVAA